MRDYTTTDTDAEIAAVLMGREIRIITGSNGAEDKLFVTGELTEEQKDLIKRNKNVIVNTVLFLQTGNRKILPGTEYKYTYGG